MRIVVGAVAAGMLNAARPRRPDKHAEADSGGVVDVDERGPHAPGGAVFRWFDRTLPRSVRFECQRLTDDAQSPRRTSIDAGSSACVTSQPRRGRAEDAAAVQRLHVPPHVYVPTPRPASSMAPNDRRRCARFGQVLHRQPTRRHGLGALRDRHQPMSTTERPHRRPVEDAGADVVVEGRSFKPLLVRPAQLR